MLLGWRSPEGIPADAERVEPALRSGAEIDLLRRASNALQAVGGAVVIRFGIDVAHPVAALCCAYAHDANDGLLWGDERETFATLRRVGDDWYRAALSDAWFAVLLTVADVLSHAAFAVTATCADISRNNVDYAVIVSI